MLKFILKLVPYFIFFLILLLGLFFSSEIIVVQIPSGYSYTRHYHYFRFLLFVFGGALAFITVKIFLNRD